VTYNVLARLRVCRGFRPIQLLARLFRSTGLTGSTSLPSVAPPGSRSQSGVLTAEQAAAVSGDAAALPVSTSQISLNSAISSVTATPVDAIDCVLVDNGDGSYAASYYCALAERKSVRHADKDDMGYDGML